MDLADLCGRLDDELDTEAYAGVDASPNGLQVGPATGTVQQVALAVDAAVETIDRAAATGADLLVTHHGIVWGSVERVTGTTFRRVAALVDDDLPLYVSHLPLDGHQDLGNAAGIAELLGLTNRAPFGAYDGVWVGQRGQLPEPTTASDLTERLSAALDTGDGDVRTLDFGPATIRDVAIVTGSGTDFVDEAAEVGADALVTGEGKQRAFHAARELGVTVVLAGHYATETAGLAALQTRLEAWGLETTFVDCPTGL